MRLIFKGLLGGLPGQPGLLGGHGALGLYGNGLLGGGQGKSIQRSTS